MGCCVLHKRGSVNQTILGNLFIVKKFTFLNMTLLG